MYVRRWFAVSDAIALLMYLTVRCYRFMLHYLLAFTDGFAIGTPTPNLSHRYRSASLRALAVVRTLFPFLHRLRLVLPTTACQRHNNSSIHFRWFAVSGSSFAYGSDLPTAIIRAMLPKSKISTSLRKKIPLATGQEGKIKDGVEFDYDKQISNVQSPAHVSIVSSFPRKIYIIL